MCNIVVKTSTIIIIFLAAIFYALTQVANKINLSLGTEPFTYTFLMVFFVLIFTLIFGIFEIKKFRRIFTMKKRDIFDVALIGVLVYGLSHLIRMFGLLTSTATNAGIFQGFSVLATMIFSYFLLKERLSKFSIFMIVLILFGAFLVSTNAELIIPAIGDLLIIFSLIFPGFTNTYAKGILHKINSYIISLGRAFFGFLTLIVISLFLELNLNLTIEQILFSALGGFFLAATVRLFYSTIDRTNASFGATFLLLGSIFTPIIAFLVLDETLSLIQIFGAILVIGGAYALVLLKKKGKH